MTHIECDALIVLKCDTTKKRRVVRETIHNNFNIFKSHKHVQGMTNVPINLAQARQCSAPARLFTNFVDCMHALDGVVGISAATKSGAHITARTLLIFKPDV